jgi:hypothetical protein
MSAERIPHTYVRRAYVYSGGAICPGKKPSFVLVVALPEFFKQLHSPGAKVTTHIPEFLDIIKNVSGHGFAASQSR